MRELCTRFKRFFKTRRASDIQSPEASAHPDEKGSPILLHVLEDCARENHISTRKTLAGEGVQAFLIDLARSVETRGSLILEDIDQTRRAGWLNRSKPLHRRGHVPLAAFRPLAKRAFEGIHSGGKPTIRAKCKFGPNCVIDIARTANGDGHSIGVALQRSVS